MDKNAIKKYAVWARNELIARVTQKAEQYEITEKKITPADADNIGGRVLTATEKKQRKALIAQINQDGFVQVMEEVAYTWFNRFTALRFMEVNNYLPSHTRVFTGESGEFKPQILSDAIQLDIEGLDMDKVFELKDANKTEELYKYLLITQCNALSAVLPRMFQKIEHYTELLLPDYLLREGSVIEQMITLIPQEDWTDQVQIIGWLYQFYNTEQNDLVYDGNMSKARIPKELVPAATTIYTPDWPVHYMVENSLGRLWLEGHPNNALKSEWKFYLDEAEQELDAQAQFDIIRKDYVDMKPEEIRVIDPCMGSGHILCVLFDTLIRIYEDYGYTGREAAVKIVENNLWGLDIDDRAAQLAYFAIMMKARQYDRRFLTRNVQPHIYSIHETNGLKDSYRLAASDLLLTKEHKETLSYLIDAFVDAKEYGSIIQLEERNYLGLKKAWEQMDEQEGNARTLSLWYSVVAPEVPLIVEQAIALSQKYHVVVTNPPYLGSGRFSPKLDAYVKKLYPDEKTDLSMVMFSKAMKQFSAKNGFIAFITTTSWMFLAGFEKVRQKLYRDACISSLVDYGTELFEGKVGHNSIVSWVTRKSQIHAPFVAVRLVDYCYSRRDEKEPEFFKERNRHIALQDNFQVIPTAPVAYWVSNNLLHDYKIGKRLDKVAQPKQGIKTADKNRFLRFWHEVEFTKTSMMKGDAGKWFPCNKGGEFRKWYGNNEYVVNWENNGYEICNFRDERGKLKSRPQNLQYMLKEGITYTNISLASFGARYSPPGFIYDAAGSGIFCNDNKMIHYVLGFLTSAVAAAITKITSPTMSFEVGQISTLPFIYNPRKDIDDLVRNSIDISMEDWDSFETSWNFKEHPFISAKRRYSGVGGSITIKQAFEDWKSIANGRFKKLKENEEELNRIFIDIYGLNDELSPEVDGKDVTVHRADLSREVRSFISYAVGCMFGRYALNQPGLVYAGGDWDISIYTKFQPDNDAIIPICDDEYFEDDIVGRFVKFVETAFGKDTLEENLHFISDILGGKGTSREVIRNYFINDFYVDHLKVYQKRPIYWLFDSGKKNGFKCLIYMHRYQRDTIARIRTDYVHEQQSRYRTAISDLEQRINVASSSERVKLSKQLATLQAQVEEIRVYEEKIHHLADQMISIDLDDGVKHNYEIFKDVLAKIK